MQDRFEKLSRLIVDEFRNHSKKVASVIKDDKDFENAIHEVIEERIGQIHNIKIWEELANIYSQVLRDRLDGVQETRMPRKTTTYADQVRRYCKDKIIDPARDRGEKQVSIRAGDIHSALNYRNRMPLVCSALGAEKFKEIADVERVDLSGPSNGSNAVFTFKIKRGLTSQLS